MTTNTKQIIYAVIGIAILILMWTQKSWSITTKIIYTLIYGVVAYFVYTKVLYPGNTDALGNSLDRTTGFSY